MWLNSNILSEEIELKDLDAATTKFLYDCKTICKPSIIHVASLITTMLFINFC